MHLIDKELIEKFKSKDKKTFSEIVEKYSDRLYNLIYKMVLNRNDSLDILQTTL